MDNNFEAPDPIPNEPEDITTDPLSGEGYTVDPLPSDDYTVDPIPADDHAADFEPEATYEQDFTPDEIAAFENFGSESTPEVEPLTGPGDSLPEADLDGYDTLAQGMLGLAQEPEPGDLDYWPSDTGVKYPSPEQMEGNVGGPERLG